MSDLDKLIEVVEHATDGGNSAALINNRIASTARDNGECWPSNDVMKAFDGSLDAAMALHEILLPGWVFVVSEGSASVLEKGNGFATMEKHYSNNPARSWLIAILKAYRHSKNAHSSVHQRTP